MKRILLYTAAIALMFTGTASASEGLSATAVCNGKWVAVTVDAPDTAIIVGHWGGKSVAVGNRFVPDAGGGNAAGDYDIDIRLELWDQHAIEGHKVLATGTVHTPTCAPAAPTTTMAPIEAPPASPTVQKAAPAPFYDVWKYIVEALRGLAI